MTGLADFHRSKQVLVLCVYEELNEDHIFFTYSTTIQFANSNYCFFLLLQTGL